MRGIFGIVKLLAALSLHHTGLLKVILKNRLRDQSIVLTYHRVIDDERAPLTNSHPGIVVSDDIFEMHMQTLRRRFNPISLHELQAHIEQRTILPERSCLVTFDDGWLDNYEIASQSFRNTRFLQSSSCQSTMSLVIRCSGKKKYG